MAAGTLFVMRNWKHPGQDLSRSLITDLFGAPLAPLVRSRQQTSTPHAARTEARLLEEAVSQWLEFRISLRSFGSSRHWVGR